jgi:1-acyl-sn-glycerol-3-phosphate acyltransferase
MRPASTEDGRPAIASRPSLAGDDVAFRHVDPTRLTNRVMRRAGEALRAYHRHRVVGMEHLAAALRTGRPVILVGNHCMDIADPLMLSVAVYRSLGRVPRFIGHGNLFFTLPVLRSLAADWGIIPSRHMDLAARTLDEERLLMLYPGSGTEAILRSYRREPYRLKWYGKLGFVELAARHDALVLFVAGVGLDEMYYQTDLPTPAALVRFGNAGDDAYYRGARLQLGLAGVHVLPGVLPLPVRVTHVISSPLTLPRDLDPNDHDALERAQVGLWIESQRHLDWAIAERDRESDLVDRTCRAATRWLHRVGL